MTWVADLPGIMRMLRAPDTIQPEHWIKTYPGTTAQDVIDAREAEIARRLREAEPVINE